MTRIVRGCKYDIKNQYVPIFEKSFRIGWKVRFVSVRAGFGSGSCKYRQKLHRQLRKHQTREKLTLGGEACACRKLAKLQKELFGSVQHLTVPTGMYRSDSRPLHMVGLVFWTLVCNAWYEQYILGRLCTGTFTRSVSYIYIKIILIIIVSTMCIY